MRWFRACFITGLLPLLTTCSLCHAAASFRVAFKGGPKRVQALPLDSVIKEPEASIDRPETALPSQKPSSVIAPSSATATGAVTKVTAVKHQRPFHIVSILVRSLLPWATQAILSSILPEPVSTATLRQYRLRILRRYILPLLRRSPHLIQRHCELQLLRRVSPVPLHFRIPLAFLRKLPMPVILRCPLALLHQCELRMHTGFQDRYMFGVLRPVLA